jgi:serine/threonine protein kinase
MRWRGELAETTGCPAPPAPQTPRGAGADNARLAATSRLSRRRRDATVVVRQGAANFLRPGTVLGRTFEIRALLAHSATGDLYRAKHIELGGQLAIKVIAPNLAGDPRLASHLAQLGRVRDDAVASYEGLLRGEGTLRYTVLEFVDGEPLGKLLDEGRLETAEILRLRDRLLRGLTAAHRQGVAHRALSIDKIILPGRDMERAKIVGFARSTSDETGPISEYAFLAPEQLGLFGGTVDGRADFYSLGLILAAAAIGGGKRLYMGSDAATAIDSRQRVPDLSLVPVPLRPVIAPMLEPRPERRAVPAATPAEPATPVPAKPAPPTPPPRATAASLEGPPPRETPRTPRETAAPLRGKTGRPRARAATRWSAGRMLVVAAAVVILVGAGAFGALRLVSPSPPLPTDVLAPLAAAVAGYDCASISHDVAADHSIRVGGHVSTAQDLARLRAAVTGIPNIGVVHFDVGLMAWPYCEVSAKLAGLPNQPGRDAPTLSLGAKDPHPGDRLVVDGHAPAFDGYVYVDYYGSDGQVVHLLPTARDRFNLKPLRNHFVLGCPPTGLAIALDKPPGQRLITLIATSKPLFAELRPGTEPVREYLSSLAGAIGAIGTIKTATVLSFFDLTDGSKTAPTEGACPAK